VKRITTVVTFLLFADTVFCLDQIPSRQVQQKVVGLYKYYNEDTAKFDKDGAVADVKAYLAANRKRLSDFDTVRLYRSLARIETTQAGCDHDHEQATKYMRAALGCAKGRISSDALWCALNVSNIKNDRTARAEGEVALCLFRGLLRSLPEKDLRSMMLQPVGTEEDVRRLVTQEIAGFRSTTAAWPNIRSLAENRYDHRIETFGDAYWLLLQLHGDVAQSPPANEKP